MTSLHSADIARCGSRNAARDAGQAQETGTLSCELPFTAGRHIRSYDIVAMYRYSTLTHNNPSRFRADSSLQRKCTLVIFCVRPPMGHHMRGQLM